ncbi:TNF receptor-associated factor 5-like [Hydra vulgaris]|uniref:TNF receptor-associated factor 5-like n=1 Tax=Hydra vulgaris TaxID=6087 RepID=A0ABM4CDW5_HYDVU
MEPEECGGYNAYFLHELLDEYQCPVCIMALREPVITLCGHRLCFSCSEEMKKRNNGVLICPLDKTVLHSEKVFPDKFTERAILQLKVKCDNFSKSCQWTGELKTINNHLTSCEYREVKCLNEQCSATLLRKELSDHMEKHCIYRLVSCQYCKQEIIFCDNQIHEEICECLPLCCVNQCGMKILRKEMSSHIIDSCANTVIPCQYLNIGCKFKGMRKEHETHANSSMQNHLSMAISKLDALESKITLTVDTLENKIASNVKSLENKITLTADALEKKIMSKVESLETKIESKPVALENKITSAVDALKNELISKVDAQKDKIMLHEKNLETIMAFLAVETPHFVRFFSVFDEKTCEEEYDEEDNEEDNWEDDEEDDEEDGEEDDGEDDEEDNETNQKEDVFASIHYHIQRLIQLRLSTSDRVKLYLNYFEMLLQGIEKTTRHNLTRRTLFSHFQKSCEMQKKLLDK